MFRQWFRSSRPSRERHYPTRRTQSFVPRVESLEGRDMPATFYPATASELVANMATANASPEADTIALSAGVRYTLTAVNNTTYGPTGLPVVAAAGGPLTVVGNGAIVERSTAAGTPAFRLVAVEVGGSLTAENLTLQNGRIEGGVYLEAWGGSGAVGGAVLNRGTTALRNVTVQNNVAAGQSGYGASPWGHQAAGGGIYSDGLLTITGGSIRNNGAIGGDSVRNDGASGFGGGVYVGGGSAGLTGVTLADNTAKGGAGGDAYTFYYRGRLYSVPAGTGGTGAGGGLYARTAAVTLASCTVSGNKAVGGTGGYGGGHGRKEIYGGGGASYGGGIYVGYGATVDWDSATSITGNTAATGTNVFWA